MSAQTRDLVHDGRASLRVRYRKKSLNSTGGWKVVRSCACHFGEAITVPFDSEERAERALTVLDDDARKYAPPSPPAS